MTKWRTYSKKITWQQILILVSLFVVVISVVWICFALNKHYKDVEEQKQIEARNEIMKDFPKSIIADAQFKNTDINNVVKTCNLNSDDYKQYLTEQLDALSGVVDQNNLSGFGQIAPDSELLDTLNADLKKFEREKSANFSFIMFDLNSNSGIYHKPNFEIPTASTIKLPYIASEIENNPDIFNKFYTDISNALKISDNNSYLKLRKILGTKGLMKWCEETGTDHNLYNYEYPEEATAKDMMKLWLETYKVLKLSNCSPSLMPLTQNSKKSIIYSNLSSKYEVYSKAGWWGGADNTSFKKHYNGQTSDGALVDDVKNPYLLFFFCDSCIEPEDVSNIIDDIDLVHKEMFKKKLVFNTPEELDEYYENIGQCNQPENQTDNKSDSLNTDLEDA